jgi:hypothetical protein
MNYLRKENSMEDEETAEVTDLAEEDTLGGANE